MKTLNRSPRISPLAGEAVWAAHLVGYLNGPAEESERRRIAYIVTCERRLETLAPDSRAAGDARHVINSAVAELLVVPHRRPDGWRWRTGPGASVRPAFLSALEAVIQLASRRVLGRLRQCEACEQWFFAANGKKRVCSDRCRSAKHRQEASEADPEGFKADRAAKMKKWRIYDRNHPKRRKKTGRAASVPPAVPPEAFADSD